MLYLPLGETLDHPKLKRWRGGASFCVRCVVGSDGPKCQGEENIFFAKRIKNTLSASVCCFLGGIVVFFARFKNYVLLCARVIINLCVCVFFFLKGQECLSFVVRLIFLRTAFVNTVNQTILRRQWRNASTERMKHNTTTHTGVTPGSSK